MQTLGSLLYWLLNKNEVWNKEGGVRILWEGWKECKGVREDVAERDGSVWEWVVHDKEWEGEGVAEFV